MQLVGVIEGVSGFVAEIHHDFARVFQIVLFSLVKREIMVGKIERDADNRLSRWAAPFVAEVTDRAKLEQLLAFEFTIQTLHKRLQR